MPTDPHDPSARPAPDEDIRVGPSSPSADSDAARTPADPANGDPVGCDAAPGPSLPPAFARDAGAAMAALGLSPGAAAALLAFDAASFELHRLTVKGELPATILARLGLDLDLAQFQGMTALLRLRHGIGRAPVEPTIGLLAEEMAVDPSRASRIASDLVARGLARREASQEDGRKSVLALTAEGERLLQAFRGEKWALLAQVFSDWPAEELAAFAKGMRAYVDGVRAAMASRAGPGA